MKVLVIEDELLIANNLIRMVKELEAEAEIFGPLTSVRESKAWLKENGYPDLILSDIQLSDGVSLDIFTPVEPACPVIFTTAYNQYAIKAFKVNGIDYLLKPIDINELSVSFRKYHMLHSKYQNETYRQRMNAMLNNFEKPPGYAEIFPVHSGKSILIIRKNEVAAFVKEEIIFLVNNEGKKFITDFRSLDEVEELIDPQQFYRANRQCIVNFDAITGYKTDVSSKLNVTLKFFDSEIPVSKEKAADFKLWVKRLA